MILPWPWAPFIPALPIISEIAQYLVHNNLLLGCQLLIFPYGAYHCSGHLFSITQVPDGIFFCSPRQCFLKHFKKPKFKILSFLVFQISSDMFLSISKVSTLRLQLFISDFLWGDWLVFCYLESLSDCYKGTCYCLDY